MPSTLASLAIATAVVLPGFVTVELSQRGRAVSGAPTQGFVLRALFYALAIHLIWSWWTWDLAQEIRGENWDHHLPQMITWTVVVLVGSPILLGLALNAILKHAEARGELSWWHYALGGRDARDAWDWMFQRLSKGAWLLLSLKGTEGPSLIIGKLGTESRVSQSPAPENDVYLQELWYANTDGKPVHRIDHVAGMWISAENLLEVFVLAEEPAATHGGNQRAALRSEGR